MTQEERIGLLDSGNRPVLLQKTTKNSGRKIQKFFLKATTEKRIRKAKIKNKEELRKVNKH